MPAGLNDPQTQFPAARMLQVTIMHVSYSPRHQRRKVQLPVRRARCGRELENSTLAMCTRRTANDLHARDHAAASILRPRETYQEDSKRLSTPVIPRAWRIYRKLCGVYMTETPKAKATELSRWKGRSRYH